MSLARLQALSPEQARAVSALLDEALSVAAADRARWQRELAEREPQWSKLVDELLRDIPASTVVTRDDSIAHVVSRAVSDDGLCQGQTLGPYRLQRLLGQGGMGTVWLAERADGLFQRQVALKLPHRGFLDTADAARERFARERDILARLEHPWIARLLDAGFSPDGHPYLALEYVEGQTLSTHCDARRLGLRERLELMLQVLSAVQYAHQNLVIHRDIKPGNILVTENGQVRLLDFGISKLMADGQSPVHDSELTVIAGRALTPDYAAPEQLSGQPVSTASDVYSLGVVLYALLCGARPFTTAHGQRTYAAGAGPLPPSMQPVAAEVALARGTTPRKLSRALQGDLDTIVLKALREEPGERYPTAEAFREDIARYLAGEPVKARPDSVAYRAWKFVKRRRVAVSATAVVVALLLFATQFSLNQAQRARAAASVATQEAERARAVQDFLLGVFMSNSDQQLDPLTARQRTARELLDIGSQRVVEQLSRSPEVLANLCATLADMYHQMGLGSDAARMRAEGITALTRVHGRDHELIAEAWLLKAQDERQAGALTAALASLDAAKAMLARLGDHGSQTLAFVWLEAAQLEQYTHLDRMREDAARARVYFKEHTVERMWSNRFQSVNIEARALQLTGELDRAEVRFVEALQELEVLGLQATAWSVTPLVWLAETQWQASQLTAAEDNLRQALGLSLFFNGEDNMATVQTQLKLGALLHQTGRRAEGLALLRAVEPKVPGAGTHALANWRSFYGASLLVEGRAAEAEQLFSDLVTELSERLPQSLLMARALLQRAGARRWLGQHAESLADSTRALQLWTAGAGSMTRQAMFAPFHVGRARAQLALGQLAAAEESLRAVVYDDPKGVDAIEALIVRAQVGLRGGKAEEARHDAARALGLLRAPRLLGRLPQLEAEALQRLGEAYLSAGDEASGCEALAQSAELHARLEVTTSPQREELARSAVRCPAGNLSAQR